MKTIFVSSTFKDMQNERDALRNITAPIVNATAALYGERISFCDLRWGVDTESLNEKEASLKVLDVCLSEIDRSDSPIVILLGDRYGWIPDEKLVAKAASRNGLSLDNCSISATALEIEYGALAQLSAKENVLVYIRTINGSRPTEYFPESDSHEEKLNDLKQRVQSITNGICRHYTVEMNDDSILGVREFAETVANDIKALMEPQWQIISALTPFERDRHIQNAFSEEKRKLFSARSAFLQDVIDTRFQTDSAIAIIGETGSGKTTMMCALSKALEDRDWTTLLFISGLTAMTNNSLSIVRSIVFCLENAMGLSHHEDEKGPNTRPHSTKAWRERLTSLCATYSENGKRLVIMVDAVDQLFADGDRDQLAFIPLETLPNVKVIISCTPDIRTGNATRIELDKPNESEAISMLSAIEKRHGRTLSSSVKREALCSKGSSNPLYLSMLMQRLLMLEREDFERIRQSGGGMAARSAYQIEMIKSCPQSIEGMSVELIEAVSKAVNAPLASMAMKYIAASRYGLRVIDLELLVEDVWDRLDFAHLVAFMNESFVVRADGRYDFMHKSYREGLQNAWENQQPGIHRAISRYLNELDDNDPIKQSEILYHSALAGERSLFCRYIAAHCRRGVTPANKRAAESLKAAALRGQASWIKESLEEHCDEFDGETVSFIVFDVLGEFGISPSELDAKREIALGCQAVAKRFMESADNDEGLWAYGSTCEALSHIYDDMGGLKNREQALLYYTESMEIMQKAIGDIQEHQLSIYVLENKDAPSVVSHGEETPRRTDALDLHIHNLCVSYEGIATLLEKDPTESNLRQARKYYSASKDLLEPLVADQAHAPDSHTVFSYLLSIIGMGRISERLGDSTSAYRCYNEAATIGRAFSTGSNAPLVGMCAKALKGLADIELAKGTQESCAKALDLLNEAIPPIERIAAETRSCEWYELLALLHDASGQACNGLTESGLVSYQYAIDEFALAVSLSVAAFGESPSVENKLSLSKSYANLATACRNRANKESINTAIESFSEAFRLSSEAITIDQSAEALATHAQIAIQRSNLLCLMGGKSNYRKALECCNSALRSVEETTARSSLVDYAALQADVYSETAHVLSLIGGIDQLEQAKRLLEQAVDIAKDAERRNPSKENRESVYGYMGNLQTVEWQIDYRHNPIYRASSAWSKAKERIGVKLSIALAGLIEFEESDEGSG